MGKTTSLWLLAGKERISAAERSFKAVPPSFKKETMRRHFAKQKYFLDRSTQQHSFAKALLHWLAVGLLAGLAAEWPIT